MHNPLTADILALLHDNPQGISEYELIQQLEGHSALRELEREENISLFQIHFLVMNALYTLQLHLWQEEKLYLQVSPLQSVLLSGSEVQGEGSALQPEGDKLGAYYRDWSNLQGMSADEVEQLLDNFWNRFVVEDLRGQALIALGLEATSTTTEIQHRYRQLAATHHPDRGGDPQQFIEIRQAYEVLNG